MYLVHPNNCLTEIDDFEAPNLEAHIKTLKTQIEEMSDHMTDDSAFKKQGPDFLQKVKILRNFKESEISYLQSYLNVINLVNSIGEKCEGSENGCDNYDYDKEDEILKEVELEMTKFHKFEKELTSNKHHWEIINLEEQSRSLGYDPDSALLRNHRNNSMSKFEHDLIEDIHQADINI